MVGGWGYVYQNVFRKERAMGGSKNVMLDLLLPMFLPDSLEFPSFSRLISYFRQRLSLSFDFIIFEEK